MPPEKFFNPEDEDLEDLEQPLATTGRPKKEKIDTKALSPSQRSIFMYLGINGPMTLRAIKSALADSEAEAAEALKGLEEQGLIIKIIDNQEITRYAKKSQTGQGPESPEVPPPI